MLRNLQGELSSRGGGVLDHPHSLDLETRGAFQDILNDGNTVYAAQHRARMGYFDQLIGASIQAVKSQHQQSYEPTRA
jgi:hypothetical protein|eukprot:m.90024 g.90024  ORF g.90024 m.90024 type:complete len:78 (+) comp20112_c0_seq3:815-1048(+)